MKKFVRSLRDKCPYCNTYLYNNFCPKCNKRIDVSFILYNNYEDKVSTVLTGVRYVIVCVVVIVVLLIVAVYILLNYDKKKEAQLQSEYYSGEQTEESLNFDKSVLNKKHRKIDDYPENKLESLNTFGLDYLDILDSSNIKKTSESFFRDNNLKTEGGVDLFGNYIITKTPIRVGDAYDCYYKVEYDDNNFCVYIPIDGISVNDKEGEAEVKANEFESYIVDCLKNEGIALGSTDDKVSFKLNNRVCNLSYDLIVSNGKVSESDLDLPFDNPSYLICKIVSY